MAYKHGHFVWFELITPEIDKGTSFYPAVVGWGTQAVDMGAFQYNMLTQGETPQCGVVNAQMEGVPPQWSSYLSVADVDQKAKDVVAAGGKLIVPGTDIPTVGRFALVADPEGATFNLFKAATGDDNAPTGVHWNELWAKDGAASAAFYAKVFGFDVETMEMPQGPYHVLKSGDEMVAGIMTSTQEKAPSMWLPYLAVEDCDAATGRATEHGATVHMEPMSVPGVGRFSIFADNVGAVVGVIKPESHA